MAKTQKTWKKTQAKSKQKMNTLTALFVLGCVAETILLVVHQLYTRGTGAQMMATSRVLTALPLVGVVLFLSGLVMRRGELERLRPYGGYVSALGVFLAVMAALCLWVNSSAAGMLAVVVPAAMVLAVIHELYVSDFFFLAISYSVGIGALWYWNRCAGIAYLHIGAAVLLLLAVLAVLAVFLLTMRAMEGSGVVKLRSIRLRMVEKGGKKPALLLLHLLPMVAMTMTATVFGSGAAVYALLLLSVVLFVAAVYYTVTAL